MAEPRLAVYNLAQPDVLTLREMIERIAAAAGIAPRLVEASWEEIAAAGIDRSFSPYAGRWVSVLDPARAAGNGASSATRVDDYLPAVVRGLKEHRPSSSHPGYAQRARETALAERLAATAR